MSTKLSLNEINRQLDKKDLDPKLKQSLKDKSKVLSNDKKVNK